MSMAASQPASRLYMPCLDGIRGLAALIVLFGHAPSLGFATTIQPHSRDYGVLIFFVLSGFLMGDIYLSQLPARTSVSNYIVARFARIVPLYFLVVILSFAIFQFFDHNFTYQITSTQLFRLLTFNGSVSVFWSVGPEVQFYGVFVFLWLLFARSKAAFFVFTIFLSAFCIATIKMWSGVFILSKFHIFACGVLLASIRRSIQLSSTSIFAAHAVSIALLVAICLSNGFSMFLGHEDSDPNLTSFYDSLPRTLIAGIIVFSFSYESRIGTAVFANKAMRLFGAISFSIYLLHEVVMYCLARWGLLKLAGPALGTVILTLVVIVVSWASFKAVEMPARVRVKRRLRASAATSSLLSPTSSDFAKVESA
jgi:peptidoglycan/LPS O-acetylase OafA/YrhL